MQGGTVASLSYGEHFNVSVVARDGVKYAKVIGRVLRIVLRMRSTL